MENLTILGWLLCKHWNDETQSTELWHIINPTLLESVPVDDVMKVVTRLIYIAVDLNEVLVSARPKSPEQIKAIQYHNKLRGGRKGLAARIRERMPAECT